MKIMNTTPLIAKRPYKSPPPSTSSWPILMGDPALPSATHSLLELTKIICAHLHDPLLCLPKLLRVLGMSRSDLHRKLKAATGMSTTEYIRYLRLQWAAHLLIEEPERGVFCIAVEVGFNDHSYFARRFREMYGVSPANFRATQQILEHTS